LTNETDLVTAWMTTTVDAKKGEDVIILDMSRLGLFAERFIIATAQSRVHMRAVADEVTKVLKETVHRQPYVEGYHSQGWILFECAGVVLHLFTRPTRDFYGLERLWADAPRLDVSKYLAPPVH
jgi:ribosome-associated protein